MQYAFILRSSIMLFQSAVAAGAYLGGDRSIRNSLCRKEEEEKEEEKSRIIISIIII